MSTLLAEDDMQVGMYVTVHTGAALYGPGCREDNSYKGDVLQIVALCLPNVVVRRLADACGYRDENPETFSLDIRRWKLSRLSKKYVRAMLPAANLPK